jgi:hypothetical protein
MSTLVAQTISNGTVSTSSANVIQGSAKAWVNFTGSNGAVRSSYNVSSVTRNGLGDYTISYTTALSDSNYSYMGMGRRNASANRPIVLSMNNTFYEPTTTSVRFQTWVEAAAAVEDPLTFSFVLYR